MQRYFHTIARISAGIVTLLMMGWFLWPRQNSLLDREEAFFAFVVAFIFWVSSEVKESDEVVFQASTKNDIRLARQMVSYASDTFKSYLEEHDHHAAVPARFLSELTSLIREHEAGTSFFQDKRVQPLFENFCIEANIYARYMAMNSSPDHMGRQTLHLVNYSGEHHRVQKEIDEANRLASRAWDRLPSLIAKIKERIPETFNEPIVYGWFRSSER